jgi:hypothetical protein
MQKLHPRKVDIETNHLGPKKTPFGIGVIFLDLYDYLFMLKVHPFNLLYYLLQMSVVDISLSLSSDISYHHSSQFVTVFRYLLINISWVFTLLLCSLLYSYVCFLPFPIQSKTLHKVETIPLHHIKTSYILYKSVTHKYRARHLKIQAIISHIGMNLSKNSTKKSTMCLLHGKNEKRIQQRKLVYSNKTKTLPLPF